MEYTVSHFIKKYESIHEFNWGKIINNYDPSFTCAFGFCGGYVEDSEESLALAKIILQFYLIENKSIPENKEGDIDFNAVVYFVNDGFNGIVNLPTPKQTKNITCPIHSKRQ